MLSGLSVEFSDITDKSKPPTMPVFSSVLFFHVLHPVQTSYCLLHPPEPSILPSKTTDRRED